MLLVLWADLTGCPASAMPPQKLEMPDAIGLTSIPDSITTRMAVTDSLTVPGRTYAENGWLYRLRKDHYIDTRDERVRYPRFIDFCMRVYRWADKTFNSHDPNYVKGDGRNWKAMIVSDNWTDAYTFRPHKLSPIYMLSQPYANLGLTLKYMAVSLSYSVDVGTFFSGNKPQHNKWDFGFSCALFNIELHYWKNDGGTYIRRFAEYNHGQVIKKYFEGLTLTGYQAMGYYFFNNKKFSWGAAQSNSNNQLRSAGSAVLGFDVSSYTVDFDFTKLPTELLNIYDYPFDQYRFHYQSYRLIGGYSYNWVINKHLVANISAIPGMGISVSDYSSTYGATRMFSIGGKGAAALSYYNKRFFVGVNAALHLNGFINKRMGFASVIQNYQAAIGLKF